MESWRNWTSASLSAHQNRSDLYIGGIDEMDSYDDRAAATEYSCLFCGGYFDVLGLCLHIDDEHPADVKAGVCPVIPCSKKVGMDIVSHITSEHANLYNMGGSNSTISVFRKEFRAGHIHSIYGGSSLKAPNAEPDPLLSSFISAVGEVNVSKSSQSAEAHIGTKITVEEASVRVPKRAPISAKEQQEAARKSQFAQGLLLSTILDDE